MARGEVPIRRHDLIVVTVSMSPPDSSRAADRPAATKRDCRCGCSGIGLRVLYRVAQTIGAAARGLEAEHTVAACRIRPAAR